jgi:outer membrane protein assembly factor BamB
VRSSPTVAANVVYIGSSDGGLYALDSKTGRLKWKYAAGAPVTSTPLVTDGLVVFTAHDGSIHALAVATGRRRWRVATGAERPQFWGHESEDTWTSSPTPAGNLVLVGSGDGSLYALELATGRVRWKGQTGGRIRSSPAVRGDLAVVGSADGKVYGFDLASGRERWRFETNGVTLKSDTFGYDRKTVQSSPVIAGDLVVVGARDGYMYGLELATGRQRWVVDHKISWINCSPAIADGMVYTGSSDGQFAQAVDLATGQERWRHNDLGVIWSSPAVAGPTVYVASTRGLLYALDRASGKEQWSFSGGAGFFSSPVIAGNLLIIGSNDGWIYALDLSAEKPLDRVVYWDSTLIKAAVNPEHASLKQYFTDAGYRMVDAAGLPAALAPEGARHRVVVFAMDYLPPVAVGDDPAKGPLRGFLEAGGKAVWYGTPPLLWPKDPATGNRTLGGISRSAPRTLLGVSHERGNFDLMGSGVLTAAGRAWGLEGWWLSSWSADTESVSTTLALDEQGNAAAWVKRYGGPAGSGFVRVPVSPFSSGSSAVYRTLQRIAEYYPGS